MAAWISSRLCVPSQNGRLAVCLQLHNQYSLSSVTANFTGCNFICRNGLLWVPSHIGWNNADKNITLYTNIKNIHSCDWQTLSDVLWHFFICWDIHTVTWSGKLSWPIIRYCLSYICLEVMWKIINTSEHQSNTGSKFKLRTLQL